MPVSLTEKLLLQPWIDGDAPDEFARRLEEVRLRLRSSSGAVLVVEQVPVDFLAALFGSLLERRPVLLGNHEWGEREWAQAGEILGGAGILLGAQNRLPNLPRSIGARFDLEPGEILIPTGGSGGRLRFTRHTWETLNAAAEGFARFYGGGAVESLCVLPLFHVSGLMQAVRALVSGGCFVPLHWKALEAGQVPPGRGGFLSLVPTQLHRLMQSGGNLAWMRRLTAIPLGGAAAAPALLDAAAAAGLPLSPSYGMTETAAMVTAIAPAKFLGGCRDCGEDLPHAQVRVREEDGRIEVRGACLFHGYVPGERRVGEWWETGDVGRKNAGGLVVLGRAGRWIASGGEKISLEEVEREVRQVPWISEVVAFGVEDPEWGQVLAVACVAAPGEAAGELREVMQGKVTPHKVPRLVYFLSELPRTAAGKIDRADLERLCGRRLAPER
jgi:o-succinylbenzoate---CoA ligase